MSSGDLLDSLAGFNRCRRAREGYIVYNPNDVYVGQAIERYGEYGELEAQLLRQLVRPGAVAIEVGANIGTHTLVLAKAVGASGWVVAYEPQRIVFQTLCANLALNSIVNVDARHAAAGTQTGSILVPEIDYTRPGNFGGVSLATGTGGRAVRIVRLDEDFAPERLDLVKIDVEGMEIDVLQGAAALLERFRPVLYVENDRLERSEALIAHLLERDYRLYWHLPALFNPNNFYAVAQNSYPNLVSVNMLAVPRSWPQDVQGLPEVRDPAEHPMKPSPGR